MQVANYLNSEVNQWIRDTHFTEVDGIAPPRIIFLEINDSTLAKKSGKKVPKELWAIKKLRCLPAEHVMTPQEFIFFVGME